jgi:pimeloyl-ACP methyl ester carboxylesterase
MKVFGRALGRTLLPAIISIATAATAMAQSGYGAELQGFNYPYPISEYAFTSQGLPMKMAYMDVEPEKANGRTVVLLNGYRVIAPDQIGFCKSAKPEHYQYSFQQLAANTRSLLMSLGIERVTILGRSTAWPWLIPLGLRIGKRSACPRSASISNMSVN